jgi:hypothetical protein
VNEQGWFWSSAPWTRFGAQPGTAVWIFSPSGFHRVFATKPVSSETDKQNGCQVPTMVLSETRGDLRKKVEKCHSERGFCAKNPSYVLNRERFFASLRMTTKSLFPQPLKIRHLEHLAFFSSQLLKTIDREIRFVVPTATA